MPELPFDLKDIVTESLKSVSSPLIDAWLGPKIRQWKATSERRDLEQRRLSEATAQVFDDYVRRVMKKVSGVTTVLAPERSFRITDIYEPMAIKRVPSKSTYSSNIYEDQENNDNFQILSETNCLIIDSAGMGKSTFVKYLTLEIPYSTSRIPIFLNCVALMMQIHY